MRVADLEGAELDAWVAHAEGYENVYAHGAKCRVVAYPNDYDPYSPSTDWVLGGSIIERERISIGPSRGSGSWWSHDDTSKPTKDGQVYSGPTALIAAMRCFVASKFGESVPPPDKAEIK